MRQVAAKSWYAVDVSGRDLGTGGLPSPPGAASAAAALATAPVITWPISVVADDHASRAVGEALGPGGNEVERMLDNLWRFQHERLDEGVADAARATPAGYVDLPLALVSSREAVDASAALDRGWVARVDRLRSSPRRELLELGRGPQLEAALHVTMLLATEILDPDDDTDVAAHVMSGGRLWLLTAAVTWALTATTSNPFSAWAELITAGLWPIGPCRGHLVVAHGGRA